MEIDAYTKTLLDYIGAKETRLGYVDYSNFAKKRGVHPPKPLTEMTINEALAFQDQMLQAGSPSSALGKYQIIRKTFRGLINQMGLTGEEMFDEAMQDRMGVELLRGRGYDKFVRGELSANEFADNLAKEWASLPYNTGTSFYAGDGLNAATTTRDDFIAVLAGEKKVPSKPAPSPVPTPPPSTQPPTPPSGRWTLWRLLGLFLRTILRAILYRNT